MIRDAEDFEEFLENLEMADVVEWARKQRPDTKEIVDMVTNAVVFIDRTPSHPIGAAVDLPQYIVNNSGVIALQKDENHGFVYTDNLCLFRCLDFSPCRQHGDT